MTIAQALGLALLPPATADAVVACETLKASADGSTGLTLLHGGFTLENRSPEPVNVGLGRFGEGFPVSLGPLPAGGRSALTVPTDRSPRPWSLGLQGSGPVQLCTTAAG
jgi:hypothetical protein